ncbi:hypothetical protein I5V32_03365 [Stenotrophomonas maltophilia]|uniref:hypothetical protein n=1 Tax=Stenotrophomonas TaxID=40323 RepID=UPI00128C07B2|nr:MULTISPECIES: hypothetical protein [Stenotrophomonas]MBH1583031.1 hypothetical protein [Stenotrophomonas maltophilia]MBH1715191.1 hypothetical protein [Stenotrophomonas maltophilia]MCR1817190.1 hypothetical protein [Stenotrophomonas muris]MDG9972331.1 hypothetical protein [Stenotrophomonas sp. GD04032]
MDLEELKDSWRLKALTDCMNDRIWGNTLTYNCLPACRHILSTVATTFPNAVIVVGILSKNGPPPKKNIGNDIVSFAEGNLPNKPDFHAWIDLDGNDIFDVVGPSCYGFDSLPYFDKALADSHNVFFSPILTTPQQTDAFYKQLLDLQVGRRK